MHKLQDYPWSQHAGATVMDVGGGLGGILAALLGRHPGMQGILFDRWGCCCALLLPPSLLGQHPGIGTYC